MNLCKLSSTYVRLFLDPMRAAELNISKMSNTTSVLGFKGSTTLQQGKRSRKEMYSKGKVFGKTSENASITWALYY